MLKKGLSKKYTSTIKEFYTGIKHKKFVWYV